MKSLVNKKSVGSEDHLVKIICAKCGGALLFKNKHSRYVCAECGYVVPDIPDLNHSTADYELRVFPISEECPNCKAPLRYSSVYDRFFCEHCNSLYFVNKAKEQQRFDAITPFSVISKKDMCKKFINALKLEHVSTEMLEKTKILEINAYYITFYTAKIDSDLHYTVELAHEYETREWNSATKEYQTVKKTEWLPESGDLNCTDTFSFQGFQPTDLFSDHPVFQKKAVIKQLVQFVMLLAKTRINTSGAHDYSPVFLFDRMIIDSLSFTRAWDEYGETILTEKIKSRINALYPQQTQNIRWSGSTDFDDVKKSLYPVWVIRYVYKNDDYVLFMDGLNGEIYRGTVPISLNRFLGKFFKWLLTLGTLFGGFYLAFTAVEACGSVTLLAVLALLGIGITSICTSIWIFKEFKKRNY